jgi:hypothetical protein
MATSALALSQRLGVRVRFSAAGRHATMLWACGCEAKGDDWDTLVDYQPCAQHERRRIAREV